MMYNGSGEPAKHSGPHGLHSVFSGPYFEFVNFALKIHNLKLQIYTAFMLNCFFAVNLKLMRVFLLS